MYFEEEKYHKVCTLFVVVYKIRICPFFSFFSIVEVTSFFFNPFFVECFLRQYVFANQLCFHNSVTING